MKDIFIVGSKGIPAQYGGYETFVDNLVTKQVSNNISYTEKKSSEVSATNGSGEKNYYRPKKSVEVTKIKDLLYEVENINIEVEIFGIDLFEAKSGYKIFTLKVTDYTDSMYVKLFTKDDEEFKRIKDMLKNGNWYSMYGRLKEDSFSNNELVFMTRFRDIQPIDAKLDWVRTDKNNKKRFQVFNLFFKPFILKIIIK